jgi:hypothetical protein
MTSMLQSLPSEINTSHLTMLRQLLARNAGNKVLLNIYITAMHLADISGGVDKSTFTQTNNNTKFKLTI